VQSPGRRSGTLLCQRLSQPQRHIQPAFQECFDRLHISTPIRPSDIMTKNLSVTFSPSQWRITDVLVTLYLILHNAC
jgi:hypothetical protein